MTGSADVAGTIGRRLCAEAIWHEGRCNWMGAAGEESMDGRVRTVWAALGPDLYAGTAGVGSVLAGSARVTADPGARRSALGAFRQAASRVEDVSHRARGWASMPGGSGSPSPFAAAASDWRATRSWRSAPACPTGSSPASSPATSRDLVAGAAGGVVGLLALADLLGDSGHLERAVALGERLIRCAERTGGGASWPSPSARAWGSLAGLSHGASGVALALLELDRRTDGYGFRETADAAFAYEETLFDPRLGNWADLRRRGHGGSRQTSSFPVAWCHGAPGIALARLRAWQLTGDVDRRREAIVALATTRAWLDDRLRDGGGNLSLCHGLTGLDEVLAFGDETLGPGRTEAGDAASRVVRAGITGGPAPGGAWRCGTPAGETPGLMLGLSGIGLHYLRIGDPAVATVLRPWPDALAARRSAPRRVSSPT